MPAKIAIAWTGSYISPLYLTTAAGIKALPSGPCTALRDRLCLVARLLLGQVPRTADRRRPAPGARLTPSGAALPAIRWT
jgi:hypothetical protein